MNAREYHEWLDYAEQFGLPDPLEQTALTCAVIANSQGNKTKPADFLPRQEVEQSFDDVANQLRAKARG